MLKVDLAKVNKLFFLLFMVLTFFFSLSFSTVKAQSDEITCDDITVVDPVRGCDEEPLLLGGLLNKFLPYLAIGFSLAATVYIMYLLATIGYAKDKGEVLKKIGWVIFGNVAFYLVWVILYFGSSVLGIQLNPFS